MKGGLLIAGSFLFILVMMLLGRRYIPENIQLIAGAITIGVFAVVMLVLLLKNKEKPSG